MTWADRNMNHSQHEAVLKVRSWLIANGRETFDPPDMGDNPDRGDFYLDKPYPEGKRIEVKWAEDRNGKRNFNGPDDFNFPDFLICEDHQWDSKEPKPFVYINVSTTMAWAYVTFARDSEHWVKREQGWDRSKNRSYVGYFSPKEYVHWIDLREVSSTLADYPRSAWDIDS